MNRVEGYRFAAKDGYCPECRAFGRIWYIQDRYFGGKREYCLMSKLNKEPEKLIFKDKKEIARWLNDSKSNDEYEDLVVDSIISRQTDHRYSCYCKEMLEHNGEMYIYDIAKNILTKVTQPAQETGWVDSYSECLMMAKEILESRIVQISLIG